MRYVLHPGFIISRTDGDRHFIGFKQLAKLYNLDPRYCERGASPQYREREGDVHLHPRNDGNYPKPRG